MPEWQKSSFSGGADGNECVELSYGESALLLRESDDPCPHTSPSPATAWPRFFGGCRRIGLDR